MMIALTACGDVELEKGDTATINNNSGESTQTDDESSSESVEPIESESDNSTIESSSSLKIIGKITYDRIGVNNNGVGLNHNHVTKEPAKQVVVKAIDGSGRVVSTTTTDNNGDYSLTNLPKDTEIKIRVYAKLEKSGIGGWSVKVVDNTNGDSQYVIEGTLVTTGNVSTRRNLNASIRTREAAPFAILGSVYQAMEKVISVDSSVTFPSLVVNWSKNNVASGSGTESELRDGQIITSHFNGENSLYILGDANSDTDEYDNHIIIHEWGHYFESKFSRADSIGGSHTNGDRLDIRVAFGEGWGNAWSAIATDDTNYFDTMGSRQANGWSMNIEGEAHSSRGWYSETSIQEILYDLYDSHNDGSDRVSLGFKPIYDILTGSQKTTPAFTSIFSFIKGLKDENPLHSDEIDTLLSGENISTIDDIYGSSQHNLYSDMQQGSVGNLCTSTEYGIGNKLNNHKYMRFSIAQSGSYRVKVEQKSGSRSADPDFTLYKTAPFTNMGASQEVVDGVEQSDYILISGDYILDVSDYNDVPSVCFDITIN
ncbi:hypothetical protein MNB_SV-12-1646 [hydrothermal vent metagenome]|uniref:Uncharacterized protein n=1 Tax=hydrothermal vent metagenome TaxID=652676 RepID=A0A1W1CHD9_9ZZZZ